MTLQNRVFPWEQIEFSCGNMAHFQNGQDQNDRKRIPLGAEKENGAAGLTRNAE
jgi:hypothetical protein